MEFVPARVAAITLEDVKCFRNTTIEFAEDANPCLIIGSNARGKSTILQALVLGLKEISRVPFTQAWRDVVKNGAREGRVTITVTAGEKTATLDYRIYNGNLTHIMNLDPSWLALRNRFIVLGYGASRHVRLEDPKPEPEIESVATLFGENGYLKHVKNSLTHSRVVEHFQPIKDLTNRILESGGHPIELEAYSVENGFGFRTPTNPGKLLPLEALSEGYKSTFVWMLDMMVRLLELGVDLKRPEKVTGVVLLDEIDLHLHPSWQRTLLPGIVKVFPGVQFIATTHSPFVVQSVESKGVTVLHVEDDTVTAETVDGVDRALSYESVVEELFGVTSLFSHDVELALVRFQELKNLVATGETAEEEPLRKEALKLAQMGVEVEGIVRRELMDLKRVTGKDLWKK
ncbi:MAG: AAA family ATPase [Acidobacteriota bacterium]|nr:AAA family ATPase [Acidobacteriota bacterium]